MRDWVRTTYGDRLSALWQAEDRSIRRVELRVGDAAFVAEEPTASRPMAAGAAPAARPAAARAEERADPRPEIAAALDPRYTFDTFVVGKPNEFAYACARRVAERPASVGFNPLFLYGGVGLGKTHLMHAVACELAGGGAEGGRPVSVAYMSAEKFMYRFIAAIRSQSTMEFKEQLRSVDVLMVDDLQFLIGKDNTQEEFFHTFNAPRGRRQADRRLVRQVALRPVRARGPAAHPPQLRHGRRPARDHVRAADLDPGGQGGRRGGGRCRPR